MHWLACKSLENVAIFTTYVGNEVEANETISFNIVMRDAFGNVAVLTRSYNLGRTPFYTPGDQDLSLLQVSASMIASICIPPSPNPLAPQVPSFVEHWSMLIAQCVGH